MDHKQIFLNFDVFLSTNVVLILNDALCCISLGSALFIRVPVYGVSSIVYIKTCVKRPLTNRQNKDLYDKW